MSNTITSYPFVASSMEPIQSASARSMPVRWNHEKHSGLGLSFASRRRSSGSGFSSEKYATPCPFHDMRAAAHIAHMDLAVPVAPQSQTLTPFGM